MRWISISKIKELREQCGLTQEEFGDKIGMSQQTVSRIEKNIDSLDIKTLKIISQYFHVPINYIIGEDTKKYNMYVHESSISVLAEYPFINQYLLSLDPEALKHINEALKIQYAKEDNECLILQ